MATLVRPIGHEDRLSLVDHLDELRSRLIACLALFIVAFAVCAWQNGALLSIVNQPYEDATSSAVQQGRGLPGQLEKTQEAVRAVAAQQDRFFRRIAQDRVVHGQTCDLQPLRVAVEEHPSPPGHDAARNNA